LPGKCGVDRAREPCELERAAWQNVERGFVTV
jgi:hypothetical protein